METWEAKEVHPVGLVGQRPLLRLVNLVKHFDAVVAVDGVSLDVYPGELISLLGPSGCGKTTLLRMIGGFSPPTLGEVWLRDRNITFRPSYERATCMVFQNYALFPHMTVFENVAYGLRARKWQQRRIEEKVAEALSLVKLCGYERRYPDELSGGQQQRVALARALVLEPEVLLLDEPLSNLDANLRIQMREELRVLQQRLKLTVLFVTHDQEEAMTISDRLVVLRDGRVQQLGAPRELYERPANAFVARFLGHVNLLPGRVQQGTRSIRCGSVDLALGSNSGLRAGDAALAVVRPEMIRLVTEDRGVRLRGVEGRISALRYAGSVARYVVETELGALSVDVFNPRDNGVLGPHQRVWLELPREVHAVAADESTGDVGTGTVPLPFASEQIPAPSAVGM